MLSKIELEQILSEMIEKSEIRIEVRDGKNYYVYVDHIGYV